jgi:hypothetical protein
MPGGNDALAHAHGVQENLRAIDLALQILRFLHEKGSTRLTIDEAVDVYEMQVLTTSAKRKADTLVASMTRRMKDKESESQ